MGGEGGVGLIMTYVDGDGVGYNKGDSGDGGNGDGNDCYGYVGNDDVLR